MPRAEALHGLPRRAGVALAIGLLGLWLWPPLAAPSDAGFRAIANHVIGPLTFGAGGRAALLPAARAHDDGASWSTVLELRIEGVADRNRVRINPRRLIYLPCVLLFSLVLASPLAPRDKAYALAAGTALLTCAALVSIGLIAAWLFARVPGLVYDLRGVEQHALRFGYEAWVSALGNRFIAPIVVSAALIRLLSPNPLSAPR